MGLLKILYFVCCFTCLIPGSLLGSEPPSSVKILVLGRTGSGKSTLINNILGRKVASVGEKISPETTTVSVYKEGIYGVSVTVCDTPGLGDASGKDEEYMKEIKASCDDPDLVVYCLSMGNTQWHTDDGNAIKTVTDILGVKIWEHSVLVLTFADKFFANHQTVTEFKQKRSEFNEKFKEVLEESAHGINIPQEKLYSVSAKGPRKLPGVQNWMSNLMISCLTVTRENGKEGFRRIILGRLADPHIEDEQPLTWTDTLCKLMQRNAALWAGSMLGIKASGYTAGNSIVGKIAFDLANPLRANFDKEAGYSLRQIISSATCSNFDYKDDSKDEL